ncbi:TIGR01777 family oxidoreductase [Candidatus Riflebacteria bacterium]
MKILISGASGFLGSALVPFLQDNGMSVEKLLRGSAGNTKYIWDPAKGKLDKELLQDFEAIIHLSGENLTSGLWTEYKKERLRSSRISSTGLLVESIQSLDKKPKTFISASAIGFYGNRDDEKLEENCPPGEGFLAKLCIDWENASSVLRKSGIRVVNLRFGLILGKNGGVLDKMLLPFKLGLGGQVGPGTQYMSWITLSDVVRAILFCLQVEKINGPVNIVSPDPIINLEFSQTLARVLQRPAFLKVPQALLNFLPGEMARETLLSSCRAYPKKLLDLGFSFEFSDLEKTLKHLLTT